MQSYDIKFSELKDALYEVAPFSIKDTDALIKKYNLKSDAVRIFNRYNGDEKKIKDFYLKFQEVQFLNSSLFHFQVFLVKFGLFHSHI